MKKSVKLWLIIATFLFVIGSIIIGGVIAMLNGDFSKLSTNKRITNEYEIAESYQNISIITGTADITILPSESGTAQVVCKEQQKLAHSVTVKDNTLVIELMDTRKWYEHIGIHFGNTAIIVYLPQSEYGNLNIKASTGDVNMPKDFNFKNIDIALSTGDVKNSASASQTLKIKTSTGAIRAENISAQDIDLSVTTGHTYLTDVQCKSLNSTGDTGDLKMTNVIVEEKISVERDTGDIKFERCDAAEIFVETSTGDITGSLLSEKVFIVETSTGKINVPKTTTGGRCELTTSTGDIKVTIN